MSIVRVNIGHLEGEPAPPAPSVASFVAAPARYFRDFETYLLALMGLVHLIEVGKQGASAPLRPTDVVKLDCATADATWYWAPNEAVVALAHNSMPSRLCLERLKAAGKLDSGPLKLGALGKILEGFGQVLATNYFERHRPDVIAKFGANPNADWPTVWNFARVVRNAMSHKGAIHFDNLNAPSVSWRGLTYSPAANGKAILHDDLWPGDLIDLIVEMDGHLSSP